MKRIIITIISLYFRQDMKPMKNNSIGETYQDAHSTDCEEKKIYVSIADSEGKMRMDSSQDFKILLSLPSRPSPIFKTIFSILGPIYCLLYTSDAADE